MKNLKLYRQEKAFMMPVVLTFMVIITSLGLTLLQASLQAQRATIRYSYTQMAHIASKAAIDYAEEQYELNQNYSGTPEQDLVITTKYRLTIQVNVLYSQGTNAKRIQAYGRVYIPEASATADYVRDIKASIIRNGEVIVCATCGTGGGGGSTIIDPATYEPLLWLDANEPDSLIQPVTGGADNQYINALYGSSYRDIVEEKGPDAASGPGVPYFTTSDLEMSYDGYNFGHQTIGLRFRGLNAPKNATVNKAYIQFTTDETKQAGSIDLLVRAVASDNAPQWTNSSYTALHTTQTAESVTWKPPNWNVVGASGANERVDVTGIVQEIVNRSGWSTGNAIAFVISYIQGGGVRTAESGSSAGVPQLYVEWNTGVSGGGYATNNGDQVATWIDKSVNNNDVSLAYGVYPTLSKGAINGMDALTFTGGTLGSTLSSLSSNNGITAFMVMRPMTSSSSNARFLSAMRSTQNDDYNTYDGIALLMRNGSTSQLMQYYRNQTGETVSNAVDNTWSIYTSRISASWVERLLRDGVENYSEQISNINYSINQLYVAGRRSGSGGTDYANVDVAEVIVYDKALECTELNEVEAYLGDKYGVTVTEKGC
ncbi:hypothetical protein KC878_00285 [Candidatus Saccharibacteria bacterium]|nr:hypothetical protein [Candidatus Saccharibacteria bacterium]MCB9821052.1 hypothetical protein [Candidatus Nomurabacteria bacterium]